MSNFVTKEVPKEVSVC